MHGKTKKRVIFMAFLIIFVSIWLISMELSTFPSLSTRSLQTNSKPVWFWGDRHKSVQEILKEAHVKDEFVERCTKMLSGQSLMPKEIWSQAYQDWLIYHNFFQGKTDGIYVEMGSHLPLSLSNTAFFDICLGWNGICVEPTSTADEFAGIRSCAMARHCMWSESKENLHMLFRSNGDTSMIIDSKKRDQIVQNQPELVDKLFDCNAISAFDLFNKFKANSFVHPPVSLAAPGDDDGVMKNRVTIDLISLDVEGAESEILSCFPWNKYDVRVWAIEVNKNHVAIDELMLAHGYVKTQLATFWHNPLDAIYVKMPGDFEFKFPWKSESEFLNWKKFKQCPSPSDAV